MFIIIMANQRQERCIRQGIENQLLQWLLPKDYLGHQQVGESCALAQQELPCLLPSHSRGHLQLQRK